MAAAAGSGGEKRKAGGETAFGGVEEEELACTVCFKFMDGEIYMCKNGHSTCGQCKKKVDKLPRDRRRCATCRDPHYDARNRPLESMAKRLPARPCENEGCDEKVKPGQEAEEHATECTYRDLCCSELYPACTFKCRSVSDFVSHLKEVHKVKEVAMDGRDFRLVCTKDNAHHYTGAGPDGEETLDENHFLWHQLQKTEDGKYFLVRVHRVPRKNEEQTNWLLSVGFLADPGSTELYKYTLTRSLYEFGQSFFGVTWVMRYSTADSLAFSEDPSVPYVMRLTESDTMHSKGHHFHEHSIEDTNTLSEHLRLVIKGSIGGVHEEVADFDSEEE